MKKRNLSQQTADTLYEMVADGVLAPGEQLPNENELATKLHISRTTLREAIHILAAQGILVIHRGRGTFVSSQIHAGDHCDFEQLTPAGSRLQDLLEARLLFEPGMAAMACRRASDQEIDHILSLGAAVEQAALSGQSRLEADRAFHHYCRFPQCVFIPPASRHQLCSHRIRPDAAGRGYADRVYPSGSRPVDEISQGAGC